MDKLIRPYVMPHPEKKSFFFVDACLDPDYEAKLHEHDCWEIHYILHGYGNRIIGDSIQPFSKGDVVLLPPSIVHRLDFNYDSADQNGHIRYLMIAFEDSFLSLCRTFPELNNLLKGIELPTHALKFGTESSRSIGRKLLEMNTMDELGRLSEMLKLLPLIFRAKDYISVGRPLRIERDVRRMELITNYVVSHYFQNISLDEIAQEAGMNRSAFCSYFKRIQGITFTQFVNKYRLNIACEMLKLTDKQVSEICFLTGFNDVPHFVRVFTNAFSIPPLKYRKKIRLKKN